MSENKIIDDFRKFLKDNKCNESDIMKIAIGSEPNICDYAIFLYCKNTVYFMWLDLHINEYRYTIAEMLDFLKWCHINKWDFEFLCNEFNESKSENRLTADFRAFLANSAKCSESNILIIEIANKQDIYAVIPYCDNGSSGGNGLIMFLTSNHNKKEYTISELLGFFKWCFDKKYAVTFSEY